MIRIYFSSSESCEVSPINQLHYCTPNLITLPERAFLWSGALLRPPLPPPQHGHRTRQDPGLAGQDRRRGLAQLPHREDGAVWKGHSGRTRQRFCGARLVVELKYSELSLEIFRGGGGAGSESPAVPGWVAAPVLPPPAPDVVRHSLCRAGGLCQGPRHERPECSAGGGGQDSGPRSVFPLPPPLPSPDLILCRLRGVGLSEPGEPLSVPALSAGGTLSAGLEQISL